MKNIGVFFGGKSVEHDISIITALQAMSAKPAGYKFIPVYIKPNGQMVTADNLTDANTYLNFAKNVEKELNVLFPTGQGKIFLAKRNKIKKEIKLDCALLCNHGHGGEDGSLQGLLELAEIPYTSCDLASSALCMDKDLTKIIMDNCDIPNPAYLHVKICEFKENKTNIVQSIVEKVGIPCIIKPTSLGSSVGIEICEDENLLQSKIEEAFKYDEKIVVEKFLTNAREFCCGVIKNSDKILPSKVIEVKKGKIYSFEEKYLSEREAVKDKIPTSLEKEIKKLSIETYKALSCSGVVRVDFLYDEEDKKLFVNEVNSIPGSLAFNLFDTSFEDLIVTLVEEGIARFEEKKDIIYKFNSNAIETYINMTNSYKAK